MYEGIPIYRESYGMEEQPDKMTPVFQVADSDRQIGRKLVLDWIPLARRLRIAIHVSQEIFLSSCPANLWWTLNGARLTPQFVLSPH